MLKQPLKNKKNNFVNKIIFLIKEKSDSFT